MTEKYFPAEPARLLLGALLAFGAVNAFGGGSYGLSGARGVPREWLAGSPFSDYLVPSLILFIVVGGVLSLAAVLVFRRHRMAITAAYAAAAILLIWILVQVAMIGYVSWLQPATLAGSLLVALLAWRVRATQQGRRSPGDGQ
jgi:hypothetical protein